MAYLATLIKVLDYTINNEQIPERDCYLVPHQESSMNTDEYGKYD